MKNLSQKIRDIRYNIRYGKIGVEDDECEKALENAESNLTELLESLESLSISV